MVEAALKKPITFTWTPPTGHNVRILHYFNVPHSTHIHFLSVVVLSALLPRAHPIIIMKHYPMDVCINFKFGVYILYIILFNVVSLSLWWMKLIAVNMD